MGKSKGANHKIRMNYIINNLLPKFLLNIMKMCNDRNGLEAISAL